MCPNFFAVSLPPSCLPRLCLCLCMTPPHLFVPYSLRFFSVCASSFFYFFLSFSKQVLFLFVFFRFLTFLFFVLFSGDFWFLLFCRSFFFLFLVRFFYFCLFCFGYPHISSTKSLAETSDTLLLLHMHHLFVFL